MHKIVSTKADDLKGVMAANGNRSENKQTLRSNDNRMPQPSRVLL
jgi:hypothetical protein